MQAVSKEFAVEYYLAAYGLPSAIVLSYIESRVWKKAAFSPEGNEGVSRLRMSILYIIILTNTVVFW